MESLQRLRMRLIARALECGALMFGEFELKSKRISPYFFNSGAFADGASTSLVAQAYAATLAAQAPDFDVLFGPAYKGIPLAAVTATALAERYGVSKGFAYSRKEVKPHGEGGRVVGMSLKEKRVVIIDDVITAGTAVNGALDLIREEGDQSTVVAGLVVMLDRQERGAGQLSAVQEVERRLATKVMSVLRRDEIISFISGQDNPNASEAYRQARAFLPAMHAHREQYGV